MSSTPDRLRRNGAPGVNWVNPDPARIALEELVAAVSEHTLRPCQISDARLVLAMNAARNALKAR